MKVDFALGLEIDVCACVRVCMCVFFLIYLSVSGLSVKLQFDYFSYLSRY